VDVVAVDVVAQSKCRTYLNERGTYITICNCKYGGIGETTSC